MWIRKPKHQLEAEKRKRRIKYEKFIFLILIIISAWVYWQVGTIENLLFIIKRDPEKAFSLLFLPIFIYFGYRNYVIHGSAMIDRPGKVCLACGKGMGFSDDGWGYKIYGTKKPNWYQFRACKTPEKCDIAYQFEVKWVEDDENTA